MGSNDTVAAVRDLIYDVGMHKGEDSDFYLKKGFRVVGFEADPELVGLLEHGFDKEIRDQRLEIVAGAIVEDVSTASVRFYRNLDKSNWGTIHAQWATRNEKLGSRIEAIEVSAVDFGECLRRHGVPYYMKIDIEGADQVCLTTLREFDTRPSYVSFESEKVSFDKLREELELLDALGYRDFMAVQQSGMRKSIAPHPAREGRYVPHEFPSGSSGLFGRELAGEWRSKDEILRQYEAIFREYERYGDETLWQRNKLAKLLKKLASRVVGRPIAGWYDTHGRHGSLSPGAETFG